MMLTRHSKNHRFQVELVILVLGCCLVSFLPVKRSQSATTPESQLPKTINIPVTVTGSSPGSPFHIPRSIFCDHANGEVYVADSGAGEILIFDHRGWPQYRFIHWVDGPNGRRHGEPNGVVVTSSGNIFITDGLASVIDIVDYRGRQLFDVNPTQYLPPGDNRLVPVLALGPEGNIYTICKADSNHFLLRFSEEGAFQSRTLLGKSNLLEQVTGLFVGKDRIVVTDLDAEYSVQIFDRSGLPILSFGQHDAGWGNFSFPSSVTVTPDGNIWVSDMIRQIVNRFDAKGNFVDFIGGQGRGPGSMAYPCSVTHDASGMVVVLEKVGGRYQVFEVNEEVKNTPYNEFSK